MSNAEQKLQRLTELSVELGRRLSVARTIEDVDALIRAILDEIRRDDEAERARVTKRSDLKSPAEKAAFIGWYGHEEYLNLPRE